MRKLRRENRVPTNEAGLGYGSMPKRTIDAREVLKDIKSSMSDADLMEKYSLSARGLQSLFQKLQSANLLSQQDLDDRTPLTERTVTLDVFRCPSCGYPQFSKFDECPQCGVLVSKFGKQPPAGPKTSRAGTDLEGDRPVPGAVKLTVYLPSSLHRELKNLRGTVANHVVEAVRMYLKRMRGVA